MFTCDCSERVIRGDKKSIRTEGGGRLLFDKKDEKINLLSFFVVTNGQGIYLEVTDVSDSYMYTYMRKTES